MSKPLEVGMIVMVKTAFANSDGPPVGSFGVVRELGCGKDQSRSNDRGVCAYHIVFKDSRLPESYNGGAWHFRDIDVRDYLIGTDL